MLYNYVSPNLRSALQKFKEIVSDHSEKDGLEGKKLVVLCEDRLSLVAERAVCEAIGGTFSVSVYTLSRFLSAEAGRRDDVLTSQGSAMAISRLIEKNRGNLQLFNRLSTAGASQDVYDTIALLYSSQVSPDDLSKIKAEGNLLSKKLHDLELLYREYVKYLEENCVMDRNAYLRLLPDVIRKSKKIMSADVLLLGFQAFTSSVAQTVKACVDSAENVYGIFIGGAESKYVNEAWTSFEKIATEKKEKYVRELLPSLLTPSAEQLREYVFEPESFHSVRPLDVKKGQINICECPDEDGECELFASAVLKCVKEDNIRYRDISVMLPDLNAYQPVLERTFEEYGIPYYIDRRYPLSSHPIYEFIINFLTCALDGCRQESVISAVSSPLFVFESQNVRGDKDHFINYVLRVLTGRNGVKKDINPDICLNEYIDIDSVKRVRSAFLEGIKKLPTSKSDGHTFAEGIRRLLEFFETQKRLEEMATEAEAEGYASIGSMSARAYEEALSVIDEAEKLTAGEEYEVRDFIKVLRSGFSAMQVSLIPPKQDAVFIGDLSGCVNAGSRVLFVGGLTGLVPSSSQDTAILTDGELTSLEKLSLAVSPKISQVNLRIKETIALNLCAFSDKLFLTYPLRSGGAESGSSEIITYAKQLFTVDGNKLLPVSLGDITASKDYYAYFNCRTAPALRRVARYVAEPFGDYARVSATYKFLTENDASKLNYCFPRKKSTVGDLKELYGDSVSPTDLENYFNCPYRAFAERGLKLFPRKEGSFSSLDSGNFIHAVLQETAKNISSFKDGDDCKATARRIAEELSSRPEYAFSEDDKRTEYAVNCLIEESVALSAVAYEQIENSRFKVKGVEMPCRLDLGNGLIVKGRVDRTDESDEYVRIIDYKTGSIDGKPQSFYMGVKLQLPLYLYAVSQGKKPAGAYYFPANIDYSDEKNEFTMIGYMERSDEVIQRSDVSWDGKGVCRYVGASLTGKSDKVIAQEDFNDFLYYAYLIAQKGAKEMTDGEITPSPVEGGCSYCSVKGCCGYDSDTDGVREIKKSNCQTIAKIARESGGGDN
ncbi:MAG: PD-(D/E)XK nuclease family protein [Candidatus Coproplasma sp.]